MSRNEWTPETAQKFVKEVRTPLFDAGLSARVLTIKGGNMAIMIQPAGLFDLRLFLDWLSLRGYPWEFDEDETVLTVDLSGEKSVEFYYEPARPRQDYSGVFAAGRRA